MINAGTTYGRLDLSPARCVYCYILIGSESCIETANKTDLCKASCDFWLHLTAVALPLGFRRVSKVSSFAGTDRAREARSQRQEGPGSWLRVRRQHASDV